MADIPEGTVRQHPNGGTYIRQGGVWVLQASMPSSPSPAEGSRGVLGTIASPPKIEKPEVRQVGNQLGVIGPGGTFTPTYTAPEKPEKPNDAWSDVDKAFAKDFVDWRATGGYADVRKQLQQLRASRRALQSGKNLTGPVVGRVPDAISAFVNPEAVSTRESVEEVVQRALRLILGAQFTEKEGERLIARAYNPALDEKENAKRVGRLINQLDTMARAKEAATEYFEKNGTLQGYQGPSFNVSDVDLGDGAQDDPDEAPKDDVRGELETRIKRGDDPAATISWLISIGRPPSEDEARRIIANAGNRNPEVRPPADAGLLGEFGRSVANIGAGAVEGLAMLPDMAANTVGDILAIPAEAAGLTNVARGLRDPITVGGLVRSIVPEPTDALGKVNRFGAQMMGGIAGFPQRAAQAVTNRLVGAVPEAPKAFNALRGPDVAAAAQRQGVSLLPADVGGDAVKSFTSAAAQAPMSRGSIVATSRRAADQMQSAAQRAGTQAGRVLPEDEAGEAVRRGGNEFIRRTRERASRFYDRAHELADGIKIMPTKAIQAIDDHIARITQAGEMSDDIVGELEKVKRSLGQEGGITAVGLREARSLLGPMARSDKLRGTDAGRIFGEVLDAASDDMGTTLAAQGKPEAARLFSRADRLWKERIAEIDQVLEPVIGKGKSGEDIVAAVEGMAKGTRGGVVRLQRMLATLPPDEKGDVAATIIDRMGRAKASAQDEAGSVFSPETFLTNWNRMSGKGKAALFGSGEVRRNLDDIAKLAAARRDTAALGSKSNTPVGLGANLGVWAVGSYAHPVLGIMAATAQYGGGKLLASKTFTKWLARTPRNDRALKPHIARLSTIAQSNPAIADDVLGLQRRLAESLGQPGRLAAEDDVSEVRP